MARDRIPTLGSRIATLDTRKAKPLPKKADPHYQTAEHQEWAEFVKRRAGYRCEHVDDGKRCWRSAEKGYRMYADHKAEVRDRPDLALDPTNGQCLCASHHTKITVQRRSERMSR
ncbi:HNH endonuclease [Bradyrhizobium barranii subsp. apii]|uniref:HNH endonuclease n=1 Tax=Bradyrhizobium barranii TaxID=2992140 RepID=UPI001AA1B629|nr:HNH endonuclease [Bradyrhizobium barranii]UPT99346.1 HNH endonuclease [Bradyrhizobium barranii subsp. apii]